MLRNWNSALSPCGRKGGARRTGSPPGGSILSTVAPRSAAILPASDVASRRHSGTSRSFTSRTVKRASGRMSVSLMERFSLSRARFAVHGGIHGTDRQAQGPGVRHLSRALPSGRREPDAGMARDMELVEWLDELGYDEAWIGEHHSAGWETDRLARSVHRRADRAHALHPAGLGRDQPAVSPSADGREPLRAARPHVARPHHAGLRPGRAAVGRLHDGHRSLDPAPTAWSSRWTRSWRC